ncbi:hypothetical protein [Sinorhizobium medicae]|uniref:hypothetical protein n=1 Tax=Sinorhizobium medicae TaxID=110321 RepID=UPI000FD91980|nr:hypothetical protein [Sinorhizobium medicae]RVJ72546.1 hypothetical protein CN168_26770 [Sinorhizobium medicae]
MPESDSSKPEDIRSRQAGGNATAAGVEFQQGLGALIGATMLAGQRVDRRLVLGSARPLRLAFETQAPVDDILVETSNGGYIAYQAKTRVSSSRDLESAFGRAVQQFVRHWLVCRVGDGSLGWNRPLDLGRDRLVLAVGPTSPASIRRDLAGALAVRAEDGRRPMTVAQAKSFGDFEACIRLAWERLSGKPFDPLILEELGRLTVVLTVDPLGPDRDAALAGLTPLLPRHHEASGAWSTMMEVAGMLMRSRGNVDEGRLRIMLETAGLSLSAPRADAPELVAVALKRFGMILILPSVLSVAASLQSLYTFTSVVADVLRHWTEFEIAIWTAVLQPLVTWLDLDLQSQLFRGLTIPLFWSLIAVRLHFLRPEEVKTIRGVVARYWSHVPPVLASVVAAYLPACFYIALNLQGMFDGYLAPGPLMLVNDTFPIISLYLGVLTAVYVGWGRIPLWVEGRPSFSTFLYVSYLVILMLFYLEDRYEWAGGGGAHQFLGLHNFFEAPALYGVPREIQLVVYILFALPIYWVGRRTGLPVAQVATGVVFIFALDAIGSAWGEALLVLSAG